MAYDQQNITSVTEIPAKIAAFAAARGWAVSGTRITNPVTGTQFDLIGEERTADYHDFGAFVVGQAGVREARTCAPRLGGTYPNSPVVSTPSAIHLFGNDAPYTAPDSEPYIAAVVEFGYNSYRHVYIGRVVRLGDYAGGDILSVNRVDTSGSNGGRSYSSQYSRYLFAVYYHDNDSAYPPGGVEIVHADNPVPWRVFKAPDLGASGASLNFANLDGSAVLGGNGDGVSDTVTYQARAGFAAGQIFVPVNLMAVNGDQGASNLLRPIGHVPGVRMCRMDDLEPGQQILVGGENWRVFPEFSRRSETAPPFTSGSYPIFETSYFRGLAYRES